MSTRVPTTKPSTGKWLMISRVLWLAIALLTVGLFIIALPARFEQLQTICTGAACQQPQLTMEDVRVLQGLGLTRSANALYSLSLEVLFAAANFIIAAIIFARRSNDRVALFVSLMLITFGPATFTGTLNALAQQNSGWLLPLEFISSLPGTLPSWFVQSISPWLLPVGLVTSIGQICFAVFFFIFPDGRFIPRWGVVPVFFWSGGQVAAAFLPTSFFNSANWPLPLSIVVWTGYLASFVFAQVYRYRHVSRVVERQQTKWVVYGISAAVGGFFMVLLLSFLWASLGLSGLIFRQIILTLAYLAMLMMPLSFGFAILRSRLWDIDVLINRTLVYVPLTAILAGPFAALITFSQKLFVAFTGTQSDAAAVVTTLVVVAAFTPIKDQLQALVDRRFKEPPAAGKKLDAFTDGVRLRLVAVDPRRISRRFLEEAISAFGATGGAVFLQGSGKLELVHTIGEWKGDPELSVPMKVGDTSFGLIALNPRANGEEYTDQDRKILEHSAGAIALAIEQDSGSLQLATA